MIEEYEWMQASASHLFDLSQKFDGVFVWRWILLQLGFQTIPECFVHDLLHSALQTVPEQHACFYICSKKELTLRKRSSPHLPSGSSAGLIWKAWFTIISWAKAMLVTPLAVSISSSTETNLGGLARKRKCIYICTQLHVILSKDKVSFIWRTHWI